MQTAIDHHTFAIPSEAITKHLFLDLKADFENKILSGVAHWTIDNKGSDKIVFDLKDLNIDKILLDKKTETTFEIGKEEKFLGSPLTVKIEENTKTVSIYYKTSPESAAVQWLNPEQTADKTSPFLFTQGQAILTRTWIPCQDSPGIRITYDAKIEVPDGLLPVMSASNPTEKNANNIYEFSMPQPIPPYLIALAIGDLEFREIGAHTGVYAEKSMIDKSAYEFEDMEKMLVVAEELYGEYPWERYDVIILPPSFPFGGMENPRLTFATPTILAGDKSLTSLIAHELAHSWSGNLVTNATWNDFWLNEGFTVYFERRIMEALYGEDYTKMLAMLGHQDLSHTVDNIGHSHADTHLHLDLEGRDPDDGMTDIAYEKGAYFLMMLESKVGRVNFDKFVNDYFTNFKFKTITTDVFIEYLKENLIEKHNIEVDINEWIYGPGIPENCPVISSDKFVKIDSVLTDLIEKGMIPTATASNWTTHEWLHFVRQLPQELEADKMKNLDLAFNFSTSENSEIAAAWYELSIKNGYYKNNIQNIEDFLVRVGRRKFLTPLYGALKEAEDIEVAKNIYAKARQNYHAVSVQTLDEMLN